ncbi:MAG: DUF4173 domain-containing protein [Bacilli bacterium]|nr:DUF4173 domain-containing protein [Bacilli bacterium]
MMNFILYIFLISLYNSFLFYGKEYGINVILFNFFLLFLLYFIYKKNNLIKNKKGLLFMIPIILISASYFIYDNDFFSFVNVFVISSLFILMHIFTINPNYSILGFLEEFINVIFQPFNYIKNFYNLVFSNLSISFKLKEDKKEKIKSTLVIVPIVLIILILLSSADAEFSHLFDKLFSIFNDISLGEIPGRVINFILFFTYLGASINYICFNYKKSKESNINVDGYTIKVLLTILNIIYIIFDFIQIKSLVFHRVASGINYAEYARSGFFQLMFISIINLVILLISKHSKEDRYCNVMCLIMVFLTIIIIASSFIRMNMYEAAYGYTLLRLLVYVTLFTLVILLIPTTFYIFNSNVNILKHFIIIIVTIYTVLSISPVSYFITYKNINRYYKIGKIDIEYLENYNYDNISLLLELYDRTNDFKEDLDSYFKEMWLREKNDIFEYNISRYSSRIELNKYMKKRN